MNGKIFENLECDPNEVVDEIKVLSWRWGSSRLKCLCYAWTWDPHNCLVR